MRVRSGLKRYRGETGGGFIGQNFLDVPLPNPAVAAGHSVGL